MTRLLTRISPVYSPDREDNVVLASPNLPDTHGFTELGYDQVDYMVAPIVVEVIPRDGVRYAGNAEIAIVADQLGIALIENGEAVENTEANQLLERQDVREALEARGFDAFHGSIPVSNYEPEFHVFWNADTFTISEPLPTNSSDSEAPYEVVLAEAPSHRI